MAISKKIRFEVFKRDSFCCQYCGGTPPKITLEADHIVPVSKGGSDDMLNLITSCFDCNRGKSNIELNRIPNTIRENISILKEKELQLKEYNKLVEKINKRIYSEIDMVEKVFKEEYPESGFTESFKNASVKMFIEKLGVHEVIESMQKACYRMENKNEVAKYFCGICWNKIKNK